MFLKSRSEGKFFYVKFPGISSMNSVAAKLPSLNGTTDLCPGSLIFPKSIEFGS